MKIRIATLTVLVALASLVALGQSVDGKWVSEGGGKGGPQTLTLKAASGKLTGTMEGGRGGAVEISDGTISGSNISFKVVREFGDKGKFETTYKGTVSGAELKLTVEGGFGGKGKGPNEVTFKKQ